MKNKRQFRPVVLIFLALLLAVFVVACNTGEGNDAAAKVVEDYYRALTDDDVIRMKNLSCASWEENAQLEYDAFVGVETDLDDLHCTQSGTDEETVLVSCKGAIIATYGNEQQNFDLGNLDYRVVLEAGEWRFCGH